MAALVTIADTTNRRAPRSARAAMHLELLDLALPRGPMVWFLMASGERKVLRTIRSASPTSRRRSHDYADRARQLRAHEHRDHYLQRSTDIDTDTNSDADTYTIANPDADVGSQRC
jgi:hypothetical protein